MPGNAAFAQTPVAMARRVAARPNGIDLDRQRKAAERSHPFGIVGDHDHAVRRRRDDLFAQQRAAAALDQVAARIDFVGAVDGQIEPVMSSSVVSGMPQRSASARVASDVGTPITLSPARTRSPSSSTKCFAVEPVPRPSFMPSRTCFERARRRLSLQFVHGHADDAPDTAAGRLPGTSVSSVVSREGTGLACLRPVLSRSAAFAARARSHLQIAPRPLAIRHEPISVVVFDLDGTLVDTAPDLINALNFVLNREGLPAVPMQSARNMIGAGARKLIERGLEVDGRHVDVRTI